SVVADARLVHAHRRCAPGPLGPFPRCSSSVVADARLLHAHRRCAPGPLGPFPRCPSSVVAGARLLHAHRRCAPGRLGGRMAVAGLVGPIERGGAAKPSASSRPTTCSAIAIEAVKPLERMPPTVMNLEPTSAEIW